MDEKNLEAVIDVVFVVCSGCSDHGTCNYNVIRGVSDNNENFRYATCNCEPFWDGELCSEVCTTDFHLIRSFRYQNR